MSLTYSFTDNVSYGTEDINNITMDLTGAGIAPFPSKDYYSTEELNTLTEALVSQGVSLEGCRCEKADNLVKVNPGIIFFENGVRMRVDADGYEINVPEATEGYIYAYYNKALQTGDIEFGIELPELNCCVLLAQITKSSGIEDKRTFARSKIATLGNNQVVEKEFSVPEELVIEKVIGNYKIVRIRILEDINLSKFNYALVSFHNTRGVFDLNAGKFIVSYTVLDDGTAQGTVRGNTNTISGRDYNRVDVEREGNKLVAKQVGIYSIDYYSDYPMTVKLV